MVMQLSKLFSAVSSPAVRRASDSQFCISGSVFRPNGCHLNTVNHLTALNDATAYRCCLSRDEKGDVSCHVRITILEEDLDEVAASVKCIPLWRSIILFLNGIGDRSPGAPAQPTLDACLNGS